MYDKFTIKYINGEIEEIDKIYRSRIEDKVLYLYGPEIYGRREIVREIVIANCLWWKRDKQ